MKKMSASETLIMNILWNNDRELSSSEIYHIANDQLTEMQWKSTTVSTFLVRLVEKGIISYHTKGRTNYYYPLYSHEQYESKLLLEDVKKQFNLSPTELFLTFSGKKVSKKNIEKLEEMMKEWEDEDENN